MKLHHKLLLALVAGFAAGTLAHAYADSMFVQDLGNDVLRPIGQIFLRSIFMIVVPLVFAALVIGVYELGQEPGLGGVAGRTLGFTIVLSAASVALGMLLVNVLRPGAGIGLGGPGAADGSTVQALQENVAAARPLSDVLIELIPRNPLESAVRALDGEMLPLMVFAVVFGAAVSRAPAQAGERNALIRVLDQVFRCLHADCHVRDDIGADRRLRHRVQHRADVRHRRIRVAPAVRS